MEIFNHKLDLILDILESLEIRLEKIEERLFPNELREINDKIIKRNSQIDLIKDEVKDELENEQIRKIQEKIFLEYRDEGEDSKNSDEGEICENDVFYQESEDSEESEESNDDLFFIDDSDDNDDESEYPEPFSDEDCRNLNESDEDCEDDFSHRRNLNESDKDSEEDNCTNLELESDIEFDDLDWDSDTFLNEFHQEMDLLDNYLENKQPENIKEETKSHQKQVEEEKKKEEQFDQIFQEFIEETYHQDSNLELVVNG